MTDDGGGHFTDTLVILIFVYLAGIATGILGFAYWQRPTAVRKEDVEEPPSPSPIPNPISIVERVKVFKPPPAVRVGGSIAHAMPIMMLTIPMFVAMI